jgi:hypothetical protein
MQALRHFYVLACNPRIMQAIDVHVRQPVYVPVSLSVGSDTLRLKPTLPGFQPENLPDNRPWLSPSGPALATAQSMSTGGPQAPSWSSTFQDMSEDPSHGLEGLPSAGHTPMLSCIHATGAVQVTKRLCPCIMPEPDLLQAVQVCSILYGHLL